MHSLHRNPRHTVLNKTNSGIRDRFYIDLQNGIIECDGVTRLKTGTEVKLLTSRN